MRHKEVKVVVKLTEGYQQRFTKACLEQLRKRKRNFEVEQNKEETA